jgi:hypothetical protein
MAVEKILTPELGECGARETRESDLGVELPGVVIEQWLARH